MDRIPIAKEGWPFILGGVAAVGILAGVNLLWPAGAALVLTAVITWFFRDPERPITREEFLLVSPADGKVIEVSPLPEGGTKISIFLSLLDVHVNRTPVTGKVKEVKSQRGRFLPAWKRTASEQNERTSVVFQHPRGAVRVVQVAGLLARRVVCRLRPGQQVFQGERYGLIRFGSRVDVFLPPEASVDAILGKKVKGGRDVIGHWKKKRKL